MTQPIPQLPSSGRRQLPPNAAGVRDALSRIGYEIQEALADLVDNSIDASARTVLIRFIRNNDYLTHVVIADDGRGIEPEKFDDAMQFGGTTDHIESDLGKYGMGLKTASFSQCSELTVLSRSAETKSISGRRWTEAAIDEGWYVDEIETESARHLLDFPWPGIDTEKQGTLVIWSDIQNRTAFGQTVDEFLIELFKIIPNHLGLTFHRFLTTDSVEIILDSFNSETEERIELTVNPLDPFSYTTSGSPEYPKSFEVDVGTSSPLQSIAHVWPPKSKADGYRLGGGQVAQRQGFYFYRNDRLIQAGGWNNWRVNDSEPHLSLARVAINLAAEHDSLFRLSVPKSKLDVPAHFYTSLGLAENSDATFATYLATAQEVYRSTTSTNNSGPHYIAGEGMPANVRNVMLSGVDEDDAYPIEIDIQEKKMPENDIFEWSPATNTIFMNSDFVSNLQEWGVEDLVKALLFMLLQPDYGGKRLSPKQKLNHGEFNRVIAEVWSDD